jgi:hypothetical protein
MLRSFLQRGLRRFRCALWLRRGSRSKEIFICLPSNLPGQIALFPSAHRGRLPVVETVPGHQQSALVARNAWPLVRPPRFSQKPMRIRGTGVCKPHGLVRNEQYPCERVPPAHCALRPGTKGADLVLLPGGRFGIGSTFPAAPELRLEGCPRRLVWRRDWVGFFPADVLDSSNGFTGLKCKILRFHAGVNP